MLKRLAQLLTGLALLTPLIITRELYFPFITGKVLIFRLLIELALLSYTGHLLFSKNAQQEWKEFFKRLSHPLSIAAAVFAGVFLLVSFFALGPEQAFWSNFERGDGALQILHYYLFFLLLLALFRSGKDYTVLFLGTLVGALFASVYGFLQTPGLPLPKDSGIIAISSRVSGTLGNSSYLAAYILFAYAFAALLFLKIKSLKFRLTLALLALFELIILFQTGTRGAFLGLFVGLFVFFLSQIFNTELRKKTRTIIALILLVIIVVSSTYLALRNAPFWSELPIVGRQLDFEGAKRSFAPRIWTWKSALAGVLERPWLGWGPENFAFAFDKYYNPNHFGLESFFDRTHNIFLEYLISGGILLLLAWLSLFFLAIRSIFKRKKKDIWFGVLLGLIAAYMVQGFFLFDVLVIYLQLFLLFAYLISAQYFDRDEVVMSPSRSRLLLLALIGILFVVNLLWISSFVFFVLLFIALGLTIFSALEREGGRYHLDPLRVLAFLLLLLITIFLLYATLYRPLKKNQLLTEAIIERGLAEKIEKYERALGYPSPLGQEEVINSIQQFSLEFESQIVANQAQVSREALRAVINHANRSFDSFSQPYIGLRNHYLNGAINLRAGASFSQADYLERGKAIFTEALEQAPTRIEFIDLLLQISIFEKDKERYDELLVLAELLRPDLDWPQYPEK